MPRPTTRRGRFLYYKARQARKLYRRRWSYPYVSQEGFPGETIMHPRGPYNFVVKDAKMQALHEVLVDTQRETIVHPIPVPFTVSPVGYKKPPHITVNHGIAGPPTAHWDIPVIGYHRRTQRRLGKKPDRLNALGRQIYFAGQWYLDCIRRGYAVPGYPPWDPLGRTPIVEFPPWGG